MAKSSTKKTLKGFLTWDNIVFMIILGSIVIYLFFQVVILKTSSPQVAVTTTSMVPTYEGFDLTENYAVTPHQYYDILRGDLLIVQNIKPQVGDVAVFKAPNQNTPIVHRLVAERTLPNGTREFATKGDHNPITDASLTVGNEFGWILESSILGVVVFAIHHIGWFSLQLQNPLMRVILIIATLGIIILTIYDSTSSKEKSQAEGKTLEQSTDSKKKQVYLKFKDRRFQIYRPKLFTLLLIVLLFTTYVGIGFANYASGQNTVQPSIKNNQVIDLRSDSVEKYSNIYFYDYVMNVSSSGFLNTVNKVVVRAVYNNLTSVTNPDYVWTIVYDYSGIKSVHPILVFNVPQDMINTPISTTIDYTVYSSGLLASPVSSFSVNITVVL